VLAGQAQTAENQVCVCVEEESCTDWVWNKSLVIISVMAKG
jgi:hypothetical protein